LLALADKEPDRELWLAVPGSIYREFFQKVFIQKVIRHYGVRLLVFDPVKKKIEKWEK
jgi:hypothetical protein